MSYLDPDDDDRYVRGKNGKIYDGGHPVDDYYRPRHTKTHSSIASGATSTAKGSHLTSNDRIRQAKAEKGLGAVPEHDVVSSFSKLGVDDLPPPPSRVHTSGPRSAVNGLTYTSHKSSRRPESDAGRSKFSTSTSHSQRPHSEAHSESTIRPARSHVSTSNKKYQDDDLDSITPSESISNVGEKARPRSVTSGVGKEAPEYRRGFDETRSTSTRLTGSAGNLVPYRRGFDDTRSSATGMTGTTVKTSNTKHSSHSRAPSSLAPSQRGSSVVPRSQFDMMAPVPRGIVRQKTTVSHESGRENGVEYQTREVLQEMETEDGIHIRRRRRRHFISDSDNVPSSRRIEELPDDYDY